jgi:hypothetical protein
MKMKTELKYTLTAAAVVLATFGSVQIAVAKSLPLNTFSEWNFKPTNKQVWSNHWGAVYSLCRSGYGQQIKSVELKAVDITGGSNKWSAYESWVCRDTK